MNTSKQIRSVLLLVLVSSASYFFFIFPLRVAGGHTPTNWYWILFALVVYSQLWIIAIEYAYAAAANLYGWSRKSLLPKVYPYIVLAITELLISQSPSNETGKKRNVLVGAFTAYILTVYGFAITYLFISNRSPGSFNVRIIDTLSAFYFSVITITTVGYGDIYPISSIARAVVISEIFVGLGFATFFFSIIASHIKKG